MTTDTKKQALVKLHAVANKIGYPGQVARLQRARRSCAATRSATRSAPTRSSSTGSSSKIGKPVDKTEWGMTPPTVNAYYNPLENNINFPAGILQPPFYNDSGGRRGQLRRRRRGHRPRADARLRRSGPPVRRRGQPAATGGRRPTRRRSRSARSASSNEYAGFTAVDDVKLNGKLTLGENTADNGGLRLALMALPGTAVAAQAARTKLDGFTPEQRVFLGWGQVWCENARPEARAHAGARPIRTRPAATASTASSRTCRSSRRRSRARRARPMVSANACRVW